MTLLESMISKLGGLTPEYYLLEYDRMHKGSLKVVANT